MSLKLRCQQGFTTVTLMGVLAVGGLLVAAGFATVDGDIGLTREDQDYKQAYGAAEGGLQWYLNRMGQDNNFYVRCTAVPPPNASEAAPVNQKWNGLGADPRIWRKLPGEQAEYTVELMPAPGYSACIPNDQYSMVDTDGNITIRVTGRSRGEYRTVLATMRRSGFIDFIYFTDFETLDPSGFNPPADAATAAICAQYRAARTSACTEIQFTASDVINGPFHTNDNVRICGGATFGRTTRDAIEIAGSPRWVNGGCTAAPNIVGTLVHPASVLPLPPSNAAIETAVLPGYKFNGRTHIALNGTSMTVTTGYDLDPPNPTATTLPLPSNGVIYVNNSLEGSCSGGYVRRQEYLDDGRGASPACGNAWVSGSYGSDLTIAADNDVVVEDDITRASDGVLLGLIANNFVRVYHPVNFAQTGGPGGCVNTGETGGRTIDAGILALQHSFIHDNWFCGAPTGDINVYGAIAQKFRGPVGTGSGATISTGFRKNYVYNDRLRYREPPFFLDPVQASWRISRETEQVPAVKPPG